MGARVEAGLNRAEQKLRQGNKVVRRNVAVAAAIVAAKAAEGLVGATWHTATPTFISHRKHLTEHLHEQSKYRRSIRFLRTTANTIEASGGIILATGIAVAVFSSGALPFFIYGGGIYLAGKLGPGFISERLAKHSHKRHLRRTGRGK